MPRWVDHLITISIVSLITIIGMQIVFRRYNERIEQENLESRRSKGPKTSVDIREVVDDTDDDDSSSGDDVSSDESDF